MLDGYLGRIVVQLRDCFRRDGGDAVELLKVFPGRGFGVVKSTTAEKHLMAQWAVEGVANGVCLHFEFDHAVFYER